MAADEPPLLKALLGSLYCRECPLGSRAGPTGEPADDGDSPVRSIVEEEGEKDRLGVDCHPSCVEVSRSESTSVTERINSSSLYKSVTNFLSTLSSDKKDSSQHGSSSPRAGSRGVHFGEEDEEGDGNCFSDGGEERQQRSLLEDDDGALPEMKAMRTVLKVSKIVKRFRQSMEGEGPNEMELSRGLQVEQVYDFWDPVSRKIRARKMNDDVWHRRPKALMQPGVFEDNDWEGSSTSSSSSATTASEEDTPQSPRLASPRSSTTTSKRKPMLRRSYTQSNTEVVTTWAALVGKLLHTKVLDFTALKDKAIRQQHYQVSVDSSSNRMATRLQDRAKSVVKQAMALGKKLVKEPDKFDSEWNDSSLMSYLFSTEYIDMIMLLTNLSCKLFVAQPCLAIAKAPCKIFGDIHGQLRDLLMFFHAFGNPLEDSELSFVFNGDFVDRGSHQLEVVGLLFALKVCFPDRVFLVRGNHEDRQMNEKYGFMDACNKNIGREFGPMVFERIQCAFNRLPVACLVAEKILCVHGGIGDGTWKLDDLRTIPRPLVGEAIAANSWIFNILWSDPIEDGKDADPNIFGVHESPRGGVAAQFAWNITKTFCARNGLSLVVRSHQSKRGSRGFDVMHENMLVRVFSARDYEGHGNDGAVLQVSFQAAREQQQPLLVVRPQVIQSTKKARDEDERRGGHTEERPSTSERTGKKGRRRTSSRRALTEQTVVAGEHLPDVH